MTISPQTTLGDIVAGNYQTAAVFDTYGIDFCCKGNRTLEEACKESDIAIDNLMASLEIATTIQPNHEAYPSWSPETLAEHIQSTHHGYINRQSPVIIAYLNKICSVHGDRHPELLTIRTLFMEAAAELSEHMQKEEAILFPAIKQMSQQLKQKTAGARMPFGTIQHPINMMMHEHDTEGDRFREIARLSDQYTAPADACTTYKLTMELLHQFEQDLHLHIHLENNILFRKAIDLEAQISASN